MSRVFGIDLFSGDVAFLCDVLDGDIGQHKDLMGWKDIEVLGHADVFTTMTYTQVLNRPGLSFRSPADI